MTDGAVRDYPRIEELVPHAGSMVLLRDVVHHDQKLTICRAFTGKNSIFANASGDVPAWAGIEYMAQCIGVHAGLECVIHGYPMRVGFLVGSRKVTMHVDYFQGGQAFMVIARHLRGDQHTSALVFACEMREEASGGALDSGRLLVEGKLNIMVPDAFEQWRENSTR